MSEFLLLSLMKLVPENEHEIFTRKLWGDERFPVGQFAESHKEKPQRQGVSNERKQQGLFNQRY